MDFNKLGQLNQTKLDQANQVKDKTEQELSTLKTQEVFVKSIQLLTKFMEGHTTRTVVVNQIRDFATSGDIDKATKVLDELHATLKTHENTDVSPVVDVLNKVVSQLEKIPKEHPELPEVEEKDYSEQFNKFIAVAESIVEAVNAQETNVEAPTVNVDAPVVNVEAPDLKSQTKELGKLFNSAIKGIPKMPKIPKTDLTKLEKEQKETTKAIKALRKILEEMPVGGGASGGGGQAFKGLVPEAHDEIALTYVAAGNGTGEIETATYKLGSTTIATLTLGYDANNRLNSVVRS